MTLRGLLSRGLLALVLTLGSWTGAWAQTAGDPAEQTAEPDAQTAEPAVQTADPDAGLPQEPVQMIDRALPDTTPDYAAWRLTAARSEAISEMGRGSSFALERLRADLVNWRERFLAAEGQNAGRIATVQRQIATLGTPPETGEEAEAIATRRAALDAQLTRLQAPVLLAQEAYAHADGLIDEIDAVIRTARAQSFTQRGASPLNLTIWPNALSTLSTRAVALLAEGQAVLSRQSRWDTVIASPATTAFPFLFGLVLLVRGWQWMTRLQANVVARTGSPEAAGVWRFVLSLGQIVVPLIGLYGVEQGLLNSGLLGVGGQRLIGVLPQAGMFVIVARWLGGQLAVEAESSHAFAELQKVRRGKAAQYVVRTGWILALGQFVIAFLATGEASAPASAIALLPVQLWLAYVLYRLGQIFVRAGMVGADVAGEEVRFRRRIFGVVGRAVMVIAAIGPVLAFAGYANATDALIVPAVMTLALLAVTLLLQGFVSDFYGLLTGVPGGSRDALIPVLIGFVLVLCALPVLALIWGAGVQDLAEVWARFRDGYTFGETRISPADFIAFAIVFGIGYMLTRLLQGALRSSILPKTRIDKGGQNAMVAGLGYVGIFLAALVAISSAGLDLSSLAIVAGALSVGIGFGLQNIVSNFVSGIILLIERPISEGDWIEVGGQMGYVRAISVRSTRIETFDRTDVIVPNADLVSGQVTNWTRGNSVGRVIVPVGVAYGTDVDKVTTILKEVAEANPMVVLTPPPAILFIGFGADSLDFEIRAILRDVNFMMSVKSEMNHAINARFREAGIEIPFAQRDLWLRNPEALRKAGQEG